MTDALNGTESSHTDQMNKPKLWSPNAAANWSLIFSPVFSAILHAKNWEEMEQPDRAKTNYLWAIVCGVFLLISVFIPEMKYVNGITKLIALALLLTWYFSQGRAQVKFIKEKYGQEYEKKKWGQPILIAIGCFFGFLILAIGIGLIQGILGYKV